MNVVTAMLRFPVMIAPYVLEILFWCGLAGTLYGAYLLYIRDHWAWWIALVLGTLITRLIFEFALLAFRSYDRLVEIRDVLAKNLKA